jgi:hypothetical protein
MINPSFQGYGGDFLLCIPVFDNHQNRVILEIYHNTFQ